MRERVLEIALIVDGFPAISQTFINNQILALLGCGAGVTILSFGRGDLGEVHQSTREILERATVVYLRTPRERLKRWLDLGVVLRHPILASRMVRGASAAGRRPGPHDFVKLVAAAAELRGRSIDFDLLFCHFGPNGDFGALMRDAGVVRGRVVTFFHGYDFSARGYDSDRYRCLFQRGDVFVANTNFTRRRILELGSPPERTLVSAVGLYPDRFPFRERRLVPSRPVRFVSVGRLVPKKGHAIAIRALRKLRDAGIAATLTIVGEGPMRGELEALIRDEGLGDAAILLGARGQEAVVPVLHQADIFVLASTSGPDGDTEGQGLALQEAQAMGLPVIASDHNGFPEGMIDGVTGILVPERNVDALAGAMDTLARHPERWADMGRAGARFVRDRFDQAKLTARLLEFLGCGAQPRGARIRRDRAAPGIAEISAAVERPRMPMRSGSS